MIENLLICRDIPRMTGVYTHKSYDLMHHQFIVGNLFIHFAELEGVEFDVEHLKIVFNHDLVETATRCDLPHPIKNLNAITRRAWEVIEEEVINVNPALAKYSDKAIKSGLNKKQHALFKACDYLDLLIFIMQERALGNNAKRIIEVLDKSFELLGKICDEHGFKTMYKFALNYEV